MTLNHPLWSPIISHFIGQIFLVDNLLMNALENGKKGEMYKEWLLEMKTMHNAPHDYRSK